MAGNVKHSTITDALEIHVPKGFTEAADSTAPIKNADGNLEWRDLDSFGSKSSSNATVDPTVSNDSTQGYSRGSRWLNIVDHKQFVLIDPAPGAALWIEITNTKSNFVATVDPTINDDMAAFYQVGSLWVNTATDKAFICTDATTGAAQWLSISDPDIFIGLSHSVLSHLDNDDHLQYLNRSGVRPMTGDLDMGNQAIFNALEFDGIKIPGHNILSVSKDPGTGEFSSIAAAVASITTASSINPFMVKVGPGVFTEPQIVMLPYVFVEGAEQDQTVILTNSPTQHAVLGADNSGISKCMISGATGSGFAAIHYASSASYTRQTFFVRNVRFGNNDTLVICDSSSAITIIFIDSCMFGQQQFNRGFVGQGSNPCAIGLRNCTTWGGMVSPFPSDIFLATSPTTNFLLEGVAINTNTTSGNCIHLVNGGGLRAVGCYFKGFAKAVWAENSGAAPSVILSGSTFEGNTQNIIIDHPGTTGFFTGFSEYLKTVINPSSSFFITNKDLNIITVGQRGADFTSISDAIASVTTATANNQFVISVGPGLYIEPQIVMKQYVSIHGVEKQAVIINPQNPNDHLIVAAADTTLRFLVIEGVTGSGKAGVYVNEDGDFQIRNCEIRNNDVNIFAEGTTTPVTITTNDCQTTGAVTLDIHIQDNGAPVTAFIKNHLLNSTNSPPGSSAILVEGVGSFLILSALISFGDPSVDAVTVQDGGVLKTIGAEIKDYNHAVWIKNVGTAPELDILGLNLDDNTIDIQVDHPGTFGAINGVISENKCFFDPGTIGQIGLSLFDPIDGDVNGSGSLNLQQPDGAFVDVTTLSSEGSAMGLLTTGDISPPVGPSFTVDVEAGQGYLSKVDGSLSKVVWNDQSITLPASSTSYIYFDSSGVLTSNLVSPSPTENIILGRVVTHSSGIELIEESGTLALHHGNQVSVALKNGFGSVFSSGGVVAEVGTRNLMVSAASYYFGEREFMTLGGNPITFTSFYQDGLGGSTRVPGQTQIDNAFWDNGTGTLAALSAGDYAKHSLYALGDSTGDSDSEAYFVVYSQAQYSALTLAEQGNLPSPPNFLTDAVVLIASIIVQQGVSSIVEVRDERPFVGAGKISIVSAATFHSGLLGLTIGDDHPQYWRNDGTHVATGNFNLGGFDITSLGTANGVVVENHHARHQPGGADAIPTDVAATLTPDLANAEGVSTSLSRANHIHNVPTAAAATLTPNQSNAQGAASTFSRADHIHNVPTAAAASQAPDQANADGVAATFSKSDHIHSIPTATAIGLDATSTSTQGGAATFSRSNHSHAIASGVVSTQNADQSNAAGTSANFARADHIHNIPTGVPVTISTANAQGSAGTFAKSDHVHNHGSQTDATQHAVATGAANGFMSSTDKSKLDGISGTRVFKSGVVASGSFAGTPKKVTVTFGSAFATSAYSIAITGVDVRSWSYESKLAGSFVINTNANQALTGEVSWTCIGSGESTE